MKNRNAIMSILAKFPDKASPIFAKVKLDALPHFLVLFCFSIK